jgi:chromosome partitioning protein
MRRFGSCTNTLIDSSYFNNFDKSKALSIRTVVFATHKGGCGKSTLAACLAVAAQEAGERVFVLDLDPKKSIAQWGSKRNDCLVPVEGVSSAGFPAALTALSTRNMSLVIVDTPILEWPRSFIAVWAADLCIVPARPATFDIWASEMTGRKLKLMDKDFVFLLNQCPPAREASSVQNSITALEAVGALLRPQGHHPMGLVLARLRFPPEQCSFYRPAPNQCGRRAPPFSPP